MLEDEDEVGDERDQARLPGEQGQSEAAYLPARGSGGSSSTVWWDQSGGRVLP